MFENDYACVHAKSHQSCLALWDPVDCSPPGSSVHGILQARMLEVHRVSKSQTRLMRLGMHTGIVIFKHALLIETKPATRLFSPFTSLAENMFYSDACIFFLPSTPLSSVPQKHGEWKWSHMKMNSCYGILPPQSWDLVHSFCCAGPGRQAA